MTVETVTASNFHDYITEGEKVVVLDFWAPWCGPCVQFSEVFSTVASNITDVTFAKVNIEEEKTLAQEFSLRSIPHVMIFKGNVAVYSEPGACTVSELEELVEQAKKITPEDVKKNIQA